MISFKKLSNEQELEWNNFFSDHDISISGVISEPLSDWDWSFWFNRIEKDRNYQAGVYDVDLDEYKLLEVMVTGNKDLQEKALDFEVLPITKKGSQKALFLDRDGIINVDHGYVSSWENMVIFPEIVELISYFQKKGYLVIVLTNQSGIARGYYSEDDFFKLTHHLDSWLSDCAVHIDAHYFSPFHKDGEIEKYKKVSLLRKPLPGMALKAASEWSINLADSLMIGDKDTDQLKGLNIDTYFIQGNYKLVNENCFSNHNELIQFLKKKY